jgi:DNA-binding winged helix-turn-helix (wHTH) protein/tetratricopeptide (TPR) repeat protein
MDDSRRRRFGPFELDPRERELRRDGVPVAVTAKSLALLERLLDDAGHLVTKEALFASVWAGTVVSDAALSRAIRELRVALGDDAGAPRYIATVHGAGFRFVAALAAAPATALPGAATAAGAAPVAPAAPASLPVVGRGAELAALADALDTARAGRRQVVFVTGEAGIGKTSLVEAFAATQAGDAVLAAGRCVEQFGPREAHLPLLEALESLARTLGAEPVRAVLQRYAPAWLAQLPWLAAPADAAGLQQALAASSSQRMLREFAQALELLCAERPLVLWLEDLHWSDHASLEVLAFVAGRREPARLLVIASLRPDDAQRALPALPELMLRLGQQGAGRELPLGLLDAGATAALLRVRLGPAADGEAAARLAGFVHRRTGGHALFSVALLDDLRRRGRIVATPDGWQVDGDPALDAGLPESLRQLVERRVRRLPEDAQRIVEAGAVAGDPFAAAAVAAALGRDAGEVEESCLQIVHAGGLLRAAPAQRWPDGTESAGFAFLHALHWQGCRERVPPARRAAWQQRIGSREEAAWGDEVRSIAGLLALRFEDAHDWPRALRHLHAAGASALARCAYVEGTALLRTAERLVRHLPAQARPRAELDTLLPLGAALMAVEGYAAASVEQVYRRALDLCRGLDAPAALERALRGLWNVALVRGDLARASDTADELLVLATVRGDTAAAADAFAKLGQTTLHRGDFTAARTHLEIALMRAGDEADPTRLRETPRAAGYLAWVLWYTGEPALARARADEALALAHRAASPHTTAFALGFVGWLHAFLGETDALRRCAEAQAAVAEEHDLVYWAVWSELLGGLADARSGAALAACARMRAALGRFTAIGARVGLSHFHSALAEVELELGDLDAAQRSLDNAADLLQATGNAYHAAETQRLAARLAAAQGRPALAAERRDAALAQARAQGARAIEDRILADATRRR